MAARCVNGDRGMSAVEVLLLICLVVVVAVAVYSLFAGPTK